MIVVTIELWPGGSIARRRTIGVMEIANDCTGNTVAGNYEYELSHAGKFFGKGKKEPFKKGRIAGFLRSLSPYRLIFRCLKDAGEV